MRTPTLKTLTAAFGAEKAREVFKIVRRHHNGSNFQPGARLEELNKAMGAHGVEAIRGEWQNGYWGDIRALYVNMGDTYVSTFVYDRDADRILVTSYGDFVESLERKGETFP